MPTEQKSPLFSIFIPSWNNLPLLKLCCESIEKNSTYKHEILIHVNDGSDGTLDWVRSKGYKYTHSTENIGVCWAMNGLRPLMTTDYIMYVNDDMYMLPGWDKALYDEVAKMPDNKWYLASTIIQRSGFDSRPNGIRVGNYGHSAETFDEARLLKEYREYEGVDWRGAEFPPVLVHRDMWDLVGGYSIEFTPGMASDPDFDAKLWLAGVRTFKGLGNSLCYHFMSKTVNRIVKNNGPIQFLRKYGITIRAFHEQMLRQDTPWEEDVPETPAKLRQELMRSSVKRLLTIFKNVKSPRMWDKK